MNVGFGASRWVNDCSGFGAGYPVAQESMIFGGWTNQVRQITDMTSFPDIKDGSILKAMHALLGATWSKLEPSIVDAVETSLKNSSDDVAGKEALIDVYTAAKAVEKFGGSTLSEILLELNDLSGGTGEVSWLFKSQIVFIQNIICKGNGFGLSFTRPYL